MKRLLKIKEFFGLQKRGANASSCCDGRPAKRPRVASKGAASDDTLGSTPCTPIEASSIKAEYEIFMQLFEEESAKDFIWWLPGRKGDAFAMNTEKFEQALSKLHFQENNFAGFAKKLHIWGYQRMNIPSLSGRIISFEATSKSAFSKQENKSLISHATRNPISPGSGREPLEIPAVSLIDLQAAQTHYLLQQEISQTYCSLLWQELQRQLSTLFIQQAQLVTAPNAQQERQPDPPPNPAPPGSNFADIAVLLQQQQLQQQIMAATFYDAAITNQLGLSDESTIVEELNNLHQQQLNNLTYQIVALVTANGEQPILQADRSESTSLQRVLVKHLTALVLLQLQQQQQNIEFLRQDRLTALALIRSLRRNSSADNRDGGNLSNIDLSLQQPISSPQMQHLLSKAAMLSLSRAHLLLTESAAMTPLIGAQPALTGPSRGAAVAAAPLQQYEASTGVYQRLDVGHLAVDGERSFAAARMASSPPPPPRATAAR